VSEKNALAVSIGVLGALAVLLTGTLAGTALLVPVWVVFLAWASFFVLGGGPGGLLRSATSNLTGLLIATLSLLAAGVPGMGLVGAAVVVGVGSAAMVQVSRLALLSVIPAIVVGFASTVGTVAVTGRAVTFAGVGNPVLVAAVALVLGGLFGIASQLLAGVLTRSPEPSPSSAPKERSA